MQLTHKPAVLILTLFLVLTGCAHDYIWSEYPIDPARIASRESFTEGREIKIIKGKSEDAKILLLTYAGNQYYASRQSFADGIADQLAKELRNRRIKTGNTAQKSLEITVSDIAVDYGAVRLATAIEFKVAFGNGRTKSYLVTNASPASFDRTCNGAVALAVIEIINDPEVLAYING